MKKYLKLAIMILLVFSLTGCTEQNPDEEPQSQTLSQRDQDISLEENNATLLEEGENVTVDGVCEFHVDYVSISENPKLFYEAGTGKTYVDFCITYKNLADYTINADRIMNGELIYSGQYEYDGIARAAEEDGSSLSPAHWIDMEPSDTRQVHYFFLVPKEVQDSSRMVELNMNICENDYRVIIREGERGTIPASGSISASGEVADGEVVITDNAEFYVEYSEFTKEVIPPAPNYGYNYYAAEEGKLFIDFCIAYTNMSTHKITADKAVSAKLNQAEAQTRVAEEGERSMFDSASLVNIIPLCTGYIHYIFQVPEELETSSEQVTISFKIDGSRYTYSVK
ncbi:MAG: hypothetical protein K2G55_05980 [Lachnospiraceae bacterium]|nr:hypothetical protein [Lachnospiraceae bacterium]MDE7201050.1 hypothetical protein [Lachnospiraceae bacterium]